MKEDKKAKAKKETKKDPLKVYTSPTKTFSGKMLVVILTLAMVLGSFAFLIYAIVSSIMHV